jgi:hypothetical protein
MQTLNETNWELRCAIFYFVYDMYFYSDNFIIKHNFFFVISHFFCFNDASFTVVQLFLI